MNNELTKFDSELFDTLSKCSKRVFFYWTKFKTNCAHWSKAAVEYFGLPGEELYPSSIWDDKIHPEDKPKYIRDFKAMLNGETPYHNCEYRIKNAEGEYVWVNCIGYMKYDENGEADFFAGLVRNMGTVNKIDPITQLRTEYVFRVDVTKRLDNGESGAILQINIDHFKHINSRYGYSFADSVLHMIAEKLTEMLDDTYNIYRLEGAQFAILIPNGTYDDVTTLSAKINMLLQHISINKVILRLNCHFAALFYPDNGQFIDQIQDNLNYAIENAKQNEPAKPVFFSEELYTKRTKTLWLTETLLNCIENDFEGFRIVLQPIIDAKTGKCYSAEALLRWSHENFPNVSPADFIPILEETNSIMATGKWVIDEALSLLSKWNSMETTNKLEHININFSYIQFKDSDLKDYVVHKLDENKLPHDTLVAELTESCRIEYSDQLAIILQGFHDEGIKIALDDFGTGYSSLMVLKDMPADIVKLDHSMTRTITDRPKDRNLVEFIITYCDKMDIKVCTEGVETDVILNIVQKAGAEYIQGYYYDRPLETVDFFNKYIK